jgi:pyridoxal phosphate enzyme (YggS family)
VIDAEAFAGSLEAVRADVDASGRDDVRIVAVTKGFGPAEIDLARDHGLFDIGESYAQELLGKEIPDDVRVHFIGRIQRNKVRKIADRVEMWHSVARAEILTEIAKRVDGARVLVQVRPSGDTTKDGIEPGELAAMLALAEEQGVEVAGLMAMGVHGDPSATRAVFAATRELGRSHGLVELSMGMSGDYRIALDEGATMLRLGSVLFGPRPDG